MYEYAIIRRKLRYARNRMHCTVDITGSRLQKYNNIGLRQAYNKTIIPLLIIPRDFWNCKLSMATTLRLVDWTTTTQLQLATAYKYGKRSPDRCQNCQWLITFTIAVEENMRHSVDAKSPCVENLSRSSWEKSTHSFISLKSTVTKRIAVTEIGQ